MNDRIPFFLREAQVCLYRADTTGQPAGSGLWLGGFVNRFKSSLEYEEVVVRASGAAYGVAHHVDETHVLNFGQSWLIPKATLADWKPGRNQQYVLQLTWTSDRLWFRRTYYGVTWRSLQMDAGNTNQFLTDQTLRAQNYVDDAGSLAAPVPPVVTAPATGAQQPLGFFRENVLIAGECQRDRLGTATGPGGFGFGNQWQPDRADPDDSRGAGQRGSDGRRHVDGAGAGGTIRAVENCECAGRRGQRMELCGDADGGGVG